MDVTTETLSPTRVKLSVTVPFDELEPSIAKAYKKVGSQVKVPGFRPGKVPAAVIDQRVGRGAVLAEALDEALPGLYGQAVEDNKVQAISQPQVDIASFGDGEPLVFTAEVDVRPEFTVPDFDTLTVEVESAAVTDADVDDQLKKLTDRQATLVDVERPVQDGDVVKVDIVTSVDGEPVEGATLTDIAHEVGTGALIPGLDEALLGAALDEERAFDTEMTAGDHAGKTANVVATVKAVQAKEQPVLDDDFAAAHTTFTTLEALRADAQSRLERMKALEQGVSARDKVLEALLEATEVPLPQSVVDAIAHERIHEIEQQLAQMGMSLDMYLQSQGKDGDEFHAEAHTEAEQAVKAQLILDAIADAEELMVTQEELTDQLVRRAMRSGVDPNQYAQQLVQAGAVPQLASDVRRGKALALVLEAAKITDTEGNVVDLSALSDDMNSL